MLFPKISIIIPSYNQGCFIESTIKSIINNGYDNYELIIIDGGSSDNTCEIINKYSSYIKYWVSEPDSGQSYAINKGFSLAAGDVFCWLNSDDVLCPGTFSKVAHVFEDEKIMWSTGNCEVINEYDETTDYYYAEIPKDAKSWINVLIRGYSYSFLQPSTFWRNSVVKLIGNLNETLQYSFDHEFFLRILMHYHPFTINENLSKFRIHDKSKTSSSSLKFIAENRRIAFMHLKSFSFREQIYFYLVFIKTRFIQWVKFR